MSHSPPRTGTNPNTRPSPTKTPAEIQEAKRLEKMQTVCSSHRAAGTAELPQPVTLDDQRS